MPFAFEYLGSDVVRSSTNGLFLLFVVLQPSGQSEVSKFDFHVLIQEEISQLETR